MLVDGNKTLTAAHVAERAGVSVGTMFSVDITRRIHAAALKALLTSNSEASFVNLDAVAFMLQKVVHGTVRSVIESEGPSTATLQVLADQLPVLCCAHSSATSTPA